MTVSGHFACGVTFLLSRNMLPKLGHAKAIAHGECKDFANNNILA